MSQEQRTVAKDTVPVGPIRLAHEDLIAAELAAFEVMRLLGGNKPLEVQKILDEVLRPRLASASQRLRYELVVAGGL